MHETPRFNFVSQWNGGGMRKRVKTRDGRVRRRGSARRTAVAKTSKRTKGTTLRGRLAACTRELEAALQQQLATSEILRVISNSPRDLQATLETIAGTAARLLHVKDAEIMR